MSIVRFFIKNYDFYYKIKKIKLHLWKMNKKIFIIFIAAFWAKPVFALDLSEIAKISNPIEQLTALKEYNEEKIDHNETDPNKQDSYLKIYEKYNTPKDSELIKSRILSRSKIKAPSVDLPKEKEAVKEQLLKAGQEAAELMESVAEQVTTLKEGSVLGQVFQKNQQNFYHYIQNLKDKENTIQTAEDLKIFAEEASEKIKNYKKEFQKINDALGSKVNTETEFQKAKNFKDQKKLSAEEGDSTEISHDLNVVNFFIEKNLEIKNLIKEISENGIKNHHRIQENFESEKKNFEKELQKISQMKKEFSELSAVERDKRYQKIQDQFKKYKKSFEEIRKILLFENSKSDILNQDNKLIQKDNQIREMLKQEDNDLNKRIANRKSPNSKKISMEDLLKNANKNKKNPKEKNEKFRKITLSNEHPESNEQNVDSLNLEHKSSILNNPDAKQREEDLERKFNKEKEDIKTESKKIIESAEAKSESMDKKIQNNLTTQEKNLEDRITRRKNDPKKTNKT
ncbi:MAG: hypothetical protein BGO07_01550 [Alphaproteobacteria bacterium 40-19]|nr:MAG: hypothetical protein BGO07_01550 [Alphaproteobacteria bacterium 40-19]